MTGSFTWTTVFFPGSGVQQAESHNPFHRLGWQRRMVEISLSGASGGGRKRTMVWIEAPASATERRRNSYSPKPTAPRRLSTQVHPVKGFWFLLSVIGNSPAG